MKKRAIVLFLVCLLCLSAGAGAISVSAMAGSGIQVVASELQLIKTALCGKKITFTDGDFKSAFAISDFKSITITSLPSSTEGTLMLGGRRVSEGQTIKRRSIGALVFVPESAEVTQASFTFTLKNSTESPDALCIMKFIDKVNYAPKQPSGEKSEVTTQAQISYFGRMSANDPEGDELCYMVVGYPENGSISVSDSQSGAYRYTPERGFTGYDRFVYVARDCYGNYTEPITVQIKVIDRMSDQVYVDMKNRAEYNAAVVMTAMGIMNPDRLGDDLYFDPEGQVTKAEFVAMAMKASGIKADSSLTKSFFDDNGDIPRSLVSYVATASRMGFIDGEIKEGRLVFSPKDIITKYEAAAVISRILGLSVSEEENEYFAEDKIPVWARSAVSSMYTLGIFDNDETELDSVATRADVAEYLYRMMKRG